MIAYSCSPVVHQALTAARAMLSCWCLTKEICISWTIDHIRFFEVRAMKKWNAVGIFTVLVIGMVFLSGCTKTASTNATPVAAPAAQTIDLTPLVTPSPAPETPTPAPVTAVPAANDTKYNEPLYKDNNPQPASSVRNDTSGGLFINIRAGGSVEGLKVFIARDGTNVSPIVYSFLPDRTVVEGENKGYIQVKIPPDGRSGLVKLMPGTYTAYLPDWNGGEPEQESFTIRADEISPIWFQGFSASSGGCGC
jgi:hypothetical protein